MRPWLISSLLLVVVLFAAVPPAALAAGPVVTCDPVAAHGETTPT